MHLYLSFQLFQVISETVGRRDNANSLYPGAPQPTHSLKKTSTDERVEAILGYESRFKGQVPALTILFFCNFCAILSSTVLAI